METFNQPHTRLALARTATADGRFRAAEGHLDAAARDGAPTAALQGAQKLINRHRAAQRATERLAILREARLLGVEPPQPLAVRDREGRAGAWRVTRHVADRWRERVGRSDADVESDIREMLERGRVTGRRPRWAGNRHRPGSRYVIWHEQPGVALVVTPDLVVTTVLTRSRGGGA